MINFTPEELKALNFIMGKDKKKKKKKKDDGVTY